MGFSERVKGGEDGEKETVRGGASREGLEVSRSYGKCWRLEGGLRYCSLLDICSNSLSRRVLVAVDTFAKEIKSKYFYKWAKIVAVTLKKKVLT